jgi:hypothetical protein
MSARGVSLSVLSAVYFFSLVQAGLDLERLHEIVSSLSTILHQRDPVWPSCNLPNNQAAREIISKSPETLPKYLNMLQYLQNLK